MTAKRCRHGRWLTACTECTPRAALAGVGSHQTSGPVWSARSDGQCPGCNLPIHAGELVTWAGTAGASAIVHEACR